VTPDTDTGQVLERIMDVRLKWIVQISTGNARLTETLKGLVVSHDEEVIWSQ
jgi:hypothetical protein